MFRYIFIIKLLFVFFASILSTTVFAEKDIYILNSHYKTSQTMFNLSDGSNYNTWAMKGSWTDNFSNFGSVNCVGQAQRSKIKDLSKDKNSYIVKTDKGTISSPSIVIASGGLSIPKIGATDFGYQIAKQFNLKVTELTPALVPLVFEKDILDFCKSLAGTSLNASIKINKTVFKEGLIFTHRGLSGPSILQISSYWVKGSPIKINLLPDQDIEVILKNRRISTPKQIVSKILSDYLPNKLSLAICDQLKVKKQIGDTSNQILKKVSNFVNNWTVVPSGTEGYKTAEVTLGGIDTKEISSSTMECKKHPGLYFVGEVLDVTGHLGGHNFQWAWSSGFLAGQYV